MIQPDTPRRALPVLTYHAMDDISDGDGLTITPGALREHLRALVEDGYRVVGLTQALSLVEERVVAVTVDDGYQSNLDMLPILNDLGASATLYMVAGCLGGRAHWLDHRPEMLTEDGVREIGAAGVEVGSHGMEHLPLDELTPTTVTYEVDRSRRVLESVAGSDVVSFCYPHGYWDRASRDAVERAGYSNACALGHGLHRRGDDRFSVRRLLVTQRDTPASVLRRCEQTRPTARRIVTTAGGPPWRAVRRYRRARSLT